MNITLTIPDSSLPACNHRLAKFNAGSGQPAITLQEFEQISLNERVAQYEAELDSDQRSQLASNERILALGKAAAAQPDKLDAIEAAVTAILAQP